MRVLVCGGRDYKDEEWFDYVMQMFDIWLPKSITTIIEGRCHKGGADLLAQKWSNKVLKKDSEGYPADWTKYKKPAGFIRNQQMLDEGKPDIVLAFPGGPGTEDMVKRAKKANIPVFRAKERPKNEVT